MKIEIKNKELKETPERLLRRAGYTYRNIKEKGKESMIRRVGVGNFPRFHAYIYREKEKVVIKLHLDQKQPSYTGMSAHSGEYDSEVVKEEVERIKRLRNK